MLSRKKKCVHCIYVQYNVHVSKNTTKKANEPNRSQPNTKTNLPKVQCTFLCCFFIIIILLECFLYVFDVYLSLRVVLLFVAVK